MTSNGVIAYEDDYIVLIVTGIKKPSQNDKTGPMAQAWILVRDRHPVEAWKDGTDALICGDCPFRRGGALEAACYVNKLFGPGQAWKSYRDGKYPYMSPEDINALLRAKNWSLRGGAYGDPAKIPTHIWATLFAGLRRHTAYTHQWMEPDFDPALFEYAMASVDDVNTVEMLQEMHGPDVRYYRVDNGGALAPNEVRCPSKNASGERVTTCDKCGLCAGSSRQAKHIVIQEGA